MVLESLLSVIRICLPVFALIGLGVLLRRRGAMGEEHQRFIAWFINTFSLPALIFVNVAAQDFGKLLHGPMILASLGATGLSLLVAAAVAVVAVRWGGLPRTVAGAAVFGVFWGNYSYLGFPLAEAAFPGVAGAPSEGMRCAGIINAFAMPTAVVLGIGIIQLSLGRVRKRDIAHSFLKALLHPVVLASLGGVACALLFQVTGLRDLVRGEGGGRAVAVLRAAVAMARALMLLVGAAGLPLALVCIGFSLRWQGLREHRPALVLSVGAKLVLTPLLALLILRSMGITSGPEYVVTVVLMAVPTAVASWVISRAAGMDDGFVAAHLTLSTALSCLTLPLWLYVVL